MVIARGEASALQIHCIIGHPLSLLAGKETLALLGQYAGDVPFLRVIVVANRLRFELLRAVRKDGIRRGMPQTIQYIARKHLGAVHTHLHKVSVKLVRLVIYIAGAEKEDLVLPQQHDGIFRGEVYHVLQYNGLFRTFFRCDGSSRGSGIGARSGRERNRIGSCCGIGSQKSFGRNPASGLRKAYRFAQKAIQSDQTYSRCRQA